MFQGKSKALTFSFDDGVTQDRRMVKLLNQYGLKATFNLNSGLFGQKHVLDTQYGKIDHSEVEAQEVNALYRGHEIAVHTRTHLNLTELSEPDILQQVEEDRLALERLAGYPIVGMAYPCGGVNNDDRVAEILRRGTPIRYARTIAENHSFSPQKNLLRFDPTAYFLNLETLFSLAESFLSAPAESPRIFYIWGHSYELDYENSWEKFEAFCKLVSGREDVFYGTNREVLLG